MSGQSSPASSPRAVRPYTPDTPPLDLFNTEPLLPDYVHRYVLVTGGLGFIGSHTVLELLKAGHNVVIVDDLSNSSLDCYSRILASANLHYARNGLSCPKIHFHQMDYRNSCGMRTLLDEHSSTTPELDGKSASSIIAVIHFAAFKAVEESIRHPLRYYKNNVNGLVDFLSLLDEFGIRNIIFSSSAAVYGTLAERTHTLHEDDVVHENLTSLDNDGRERLVQAGCTGITSPYGRTKFFGEAILFDLAQSDPAWNIVALRYFNPIGCDFFGLLGEDPTGSPSNLLPMIVKVMTGQLSQLSIYGNDWSTPDGTAVRDFIHVSDLARGHIAALSGIQTGRVQRGFRTFNLGVGNGYSVLDVVSTMESVSQMHIPRKIVGRRAGDVQSSVAAADRARVELGWQTKESLLDACEHTWNSLKVRGW